MWSTTTPTPNVSRMAEAGSGTAASPIMVNGIWSATGTPVNCQEVPPSGEKTGCSGNPIVPVSIQYSLYRCSEVVLGVVTVRRTK